ncbi:porin [Paraburkholderia sp. USG1]|uniref:porin n=1 Tax=Paraburkholderia sp. USG1 TaxID=2952268 RepID=UPI00285933BA|nr:porin [Paraburkholderia sp. USG1]MDR8398296.1 porin [Paraburkholderia sp. USG1]
MDGKNTVTRGGVLGASKPATIVVALCLAGAAQAAYADSNVTLYGVIDEGIDYVNNSGGSSLVRLRDGTWDGIYGSRFGLKGAEDLGGGLKAIFRLESGFDATNGKNLQGGRLFGRSAYVGLQDDRYGTVTFGRQYDLVTDYLQPVTSNGQFTGPFVHAGDIDNTANTYRIDNAVKYVSPSIAGLTLSGMYSFSGSTTLGTTGMWSVAAAWEHAGLNLAAVYDHFNNPGLLTNDGNFIVNTTGSAVGASGAFSYVGSPRNQQIIGVGGSYAIGDATAGFTYTNTRFDDANGTTSSVVFNNYDIWLKYSITPSTTVGGAYIYSDGKVNYNGERPKYHTAGLFASYTLSKTTMLYAMGAFQQAAGDAKQADIYDYAIADASSTNRQLMFRVGMNHRF